MATARGKAGGKQRVFSRLVAALPILMCGGLLGLVGAGFKPALAEQQPPAQTQPPAVQVPQAPRAQAEAPPETLHILVGRSLVITSPARIKRVSVADPTIVEAVAVSPNQILLNGKGPGAVSLVLWDEADQSQTFEVFVDLDVLGLAQSIREAFPSEPVKVEATKNIMTLSGRVSSEAVANKILEIAVAMAPKKENVISVMEVPVAPLRGEILLQVKFAEVDRTAINQLGINLMSLPPAKNIGSISTQQFSPPTLAGQLGATTGGFQLGDLLNIFIFRPDIDLAAIIRALEQQSLLQILAEPNVLTETGKEASFLAGGEFPFPIVQPGGAGGVPVVTIQFREFGVRLNFKPTLLADGRIHLHVKPEVSTLDFANAVTIAGFLIPALSTRRVESQMELQNGQTFAIAGLVDDRLTDIATKVPGLGDIPVLGKLFRSRSRTKSKTELLVMVTPRIASPSPPAPAPVGPQFPKPFLPPAVPEKPGSGPGQM